MGYYNYEDFSSVLKTKSEAPLVVKKQSLAESISLISSQNGVSPLLSLAIVDQESGGKIDAIRFEPSQIERARRVVGNKSADELHQYASSHGLFQIMGYHAKRFNLSWVDLYKPETNITIGTKILAECINKSKKVSKYDRIFDGLVCYNGSEKYAKEVIGRLGKTLIERGL